MITGLSGSQSEVEYTLKFGPIISNLYAWLILRGRSGQKEGCRSQCKGLVSWAGASAVSHYDGQPLFQ